MKYIEAREPLSMAEITGSQHMEKKHTIKREQDG